MSSATWKTSLRLWLIRTTPRPRSASRRTSLSTCSVWATPRAAVGSSRITSWSSTAPRGRSRRSAADRPRARRRACAPTARVRTERPSRVSRAAASMASSSSSPRLVHLAAEEHVVDDVEVVAQREVLVDDLDAEGVRVLGAVDVTGWPSKVYSPSSKAWMPAMPLIRVLLPAPLSPTSAVTSPGVDVEVDAAEHVHGAEALVDARAG